MKLTKNQVIVKDKELGTEWIYDVNPEDIEILNKRGERDKNGNLILSSPFVAVLSKWTTDKVLENVENYMNEEVNVPNIPKPKDGEKIVNVANFSECTNQELEKFLMIYGGYKAYIESQLAYITSKKGVLEASFEEGLNKMMYVLSQEEREKRVTKEVLRGEALTSNPQLKKAKQDFIEIEGVYNRLIGLRDAYKSLFDTVSRIISIRTLESRRDS